MQLYIIGAVHTFKHLEIVHTMYMIIHLYVLVQCQNCNTNSTLSTVILLYFIFTVNAVIQFHIFSIIYTVHVKKSRDEPNSGVRMVTLEDCSICGLGEDAMMLVIKVKVCWNY